MKDLPFNAFLSRCQLWRACSSGDSREALEYVYFSNGFAYASDSHILARVPLVYVTSLDEDSRLLLNGHGIHHDLLKYLTNFECLSIEKEIGKDKEGKEVERVCIYAAQGKNEVRVMLTNPEDVRPPKFDELFTTPGERVPISKIGVSQRYLGRLSSAIGTAEIRLSFLSEKRQIFVHPLSLELDGAEGVIMPIMVTGTIDGFEYNGGAADRGRQMLIIG